MAYSGCSSLQKTIEDGQIVVLGCFSRLEERKGSWGGQERAGGGGGWGLGKFDFWLEAYNWFVLQETS